MWFRSLVCRTLNMLWYLTVFSAFVPLVLLALQQGVAGANKSANFTFYSFISIKKSDPEKQSEMAFTKLFFRKYRPSSFIAEMVVSLSHQFVISRLAGAKGRPMRKRTHAKELLCEHGPRFWTKYYGMFEWSFQGVRATPQEIARDSFEACIARISGCAIPDAIRFCP